MTKSILLPADIIKTGRISGTVWTCSVLLKSAMSAQACICPQN